MSLAPITRKVSGKMFNRLPLVVLLMGLVVLLSPSRDDRARWTAAQNHWQHAESVLQAHQNAALKEASLLQMDVVTCPDNPGATIASCLDHQAQTAQSSLARLVVADAWNSLINATPLTDTPLLQQRIAHGLLALNYLQAASAHDDHDWAVLTQAFKDQVRACNNEWPFFLCRAWLQHDADTWDLDWDTVNNVVLPSHDAAIVPSFVNDHRQAWADLATQAVQSEHLSSAAVSTNPSAQTLNGEDPTDDSDRDRSRSRERPTRERRDRSNVIVPHL